MAHLLVCLSSISATSDLYAYGSAHMISPCHFCFYAGRPSDPAQIILLTLAINYVSEASRDVDISTHHWAVPCDNL